MAGNNYYPGQYEFQCLHGMGEPLYEQVVGKVADGKLNRPCRIYAPVGTHETLLAYLVRRLLENGANTSFVNRIADHTIAARRAGCRSGHRRSNPGHSEGRLRSCRIRASRCRVNCMGANAHQLQRPRPVERTASGVAVQRLADQRYSTTGAQSRCSVDDSELRSTVEQPVHQPCRPGRRGRLCTRSHRR
jgi:hypothetical protein